MAKGLANGLPIGAFMVNKKYSQVLTYGDHASTFGGNPISTAGANVVVDEIINNGILNNVKINGEYLFAQLNKLKSKYDFIKDVRGLGFMIGIEFEDGLIGYISDSWITPQKHVTLLVRGTKATAILDDTVAENKLKLYDNQPGSAVKDIPLDYLEIEPLKLECQHFVSCIENHTKARSDGDNGFMVTKILEEAERVMLGAKVNALNERHFALSRTKQFQ